MVWLQAHLMTIVVWWSIIGALFGTFGAVMPKSKFQAFIMALAHISPMNVISAIKEVGAAFVPPTLPPPPAGGSSAAGIAGTTTTIVALALVAGAGLTGSETGCGAATPSPTAQSCIARYQACGLGTPDMPSFIACRDEVDKDCIPSKTAPALGSPKDGGQ